MGARGERLVSIQYLRAIAALMVVVHHARNNQWWLFSPMAGYEAFAWGVDIFFVISGFIMYVAARHDDVGPFLVKRVIRVVPLYWITSFVFLLVKTKLQLWRFDAETLIYWGKSLFFIPYSNLGHPGHLFPYLEVGWTLNYEMFFYALFALGIVWNRTILVPSLAIVGLFCVGLFYQHESMVLWVFTRPILLEFVLGLWVGYAYVEKKLPRRCWPLVGLGFVLLFLLPWIAEGAMEEAGKIVASTMIIAGAAALGTGAPQNNLWNLLGDASYSIYLTHTVISLRLARSIWKGAPLEGWWQFGGWVILTLLLSSVIGVLVHLYVEKPMMRRLRPPRDAGGVCRSSSKVSTEKAGDGRSSPRPM